MRFAASFDIFANKLNLFDEFIFIRINDLEESRSFENYWDSGRGSRNPS